MRVLISALLLAGLLATLVPAVSRAAGFTVTNLNDSGSGSLRQALADAKAAGGDDIIAFHAGLTGTITVTSWLVIDSNVTIQGPGAELLTISGGNTTRVFLVKDGVTATIDGLTISDGQVGSNERGGGIMITSSTLTITNSAFSGNYGGWGGAVAASWSTLTITDSTFSGNEGYIGAAIHSDDSVLRIEKTTVEHNDSSYVAGGVSSMGTGSVTIVASIFTDNTGDGSAFGGAVYAEGRNDLTVIDSTFFNNDAGPLGSFGGAIAKSFGTLTVTGSSFVENKSDGAGGAIYSSSATMHISDSEFVENTSWGGGAIHADGEQAANTINNSTFDRNRAVYDGGALYAGVPVTIVNSTFTGNTAKNGGGMAVLHWLSASDFVVANSTFSGNSATDRGNSIATWSRMTIAGSIFADQDGSSCWVNDPGTLITAEIIDAGYNLSSDATCVSADTSLANTDPLLGPLADNGGPTRTHALLPGSPALDRIPAGTLGCGTTLATDQRGITRPQDTACDSGAYEAEPDDSAPDVTVTGIADGAVYTLGDAIPEVGCETTDAGSGVATAATLSTSGGPVGPITLTCAGATDNAGNVADPVSVTYAVVYAWDGFFRPVDNLPAINAVKAGSAVPVKFALAGDRGLAAVVSITSGRIACDTSGLVEDVDETVSAGNSSLQYDVSTGQYIYVWKTDKTWSTTCRMLTVTLADGTSHDALFTFR